MLIYSLSLVSFLIKWKELKAVRKASQFAVEIFFEFFHIRLYFFYEFLGHEIFIFLKKIWLSKKVQSSLAKPQAIPQNKHYPTPQKKKNHLVPQSRLIYHNCIAKI